MLQQDLHIHTTYSTSDNSVVPEQTIALVAAVKHAIIVGISDHFECLVNGDFEDYEKEIRQVGLKVGVEVDGHPWVDEATNYDVDYFFLLPGSECRLSFSGQIAHDRQACHNSSSQCFAHKP
jgi:predicted metal-dependent phosphoesterase TrpH